MEKEKEIKPGDLVKLSPVYCSQEYADKVGVGLYLGVGEEGWYFVHWFSRLHHARCHDRQMVKVS